MEELLPVFPKNIRTFVDMFGGGFNVGLNVPSEFILYNDIETHVKNFLQYLYVTDVEEVLSSIDALIDKFKLSKENSTGYAKLREYYNQNTMDNSAFYTLVAFAYNHQIRYNSKGQFNTPFGKNRCCFNQTLRENMVNFVETIQVKQITFQNKNFESLDLSNLKNTDFVYADPPYLNSVATYNEKKGWTEKNEASLLTILDGLDRQKVRFALSNNFKYTNPILKEWAKKYKIHYINANYKNCSYNKHDKSTDIEVLITNY